MFGFDKFHVYRHLPQNPNLKNQITNLKFKTDIDIQQVQSLLLSLAGFMSPFFRSDKSRPYQSSLFWDIGVLNLKIVCDLFFGAWNFRPQ